ncbi:MAG: hypothetical protein IT360_27300 [Gemmatimonadaceae bacterium]|nr:hypothetical protein [Gemmatimonadaceae bacterium]
MNDEQLREAYERTLPSGDRRPPLDDVAAERLRRLAEGEGSDEERLHTLDALLSTAEGRRDLEIVWGASRAARPPRRSRVRWLSAAGVLLAVGLGGSVWVTRRADVSVVRSGDSPIALVEPGNLTTASEVSRFVWRPLADAERYVFVIADGDGNTVATVETRDTVVTIPSGVRLEAGREYFWWVEATTRLGATVTAASQRLTITSR